MGIAKRLYGPLVVASLLLGINWVAFSLYSAWVLGGDAEHGKVTRNQFFVGGHGQYREVPSEVYWFNWYYGHVADDALFGTLILTAVCALLSGQFRGSRDASDEQAP